MEQHVYARWLDIGTRIALVVLIVSLLIYLLGILDPLVPLQDLPRLWTLPADRYVAATGAPTGWGWLGFLSRGDYLNLLGVALLATITVVCYARILPLLPRLQAVLAAIQIAILLGAAFL
jgi:hypothetical protein